MNGRLATASALFVALVLHAWASGAYAQDAVVLLFLLLSVLFGARAPLGKVPERAVATGAAIGGAAAAWTHLPDIGYGPGAIPRTASAIALGMIAGAASRVFTRGPASGDTATVVMATIAVGASGTTRLGPAYAAFAAVFMLLALFAMRMRDPAHARAEHVAGRSRAAFLLAMALAAVVSVGLVRTIPPVHDRVQRAIENSLVMHDMVGFGGGASLDDMRDMIDSDLEVLRVSPPRPSVVVDHLRGGVYDIYDTEGMWSESPQRNFVVEVRSDVAARGTAVRVHRVTGNKGRYFLPLGVRDLRVLSGSVTVDSLGTVFTDGEAPPIDYSFELGPRDKLGLRDPINFDRYVPRGAERETIGALAREWTAGATTDAAKLDAIEKQLHANYTYSLTAKHDVADPLLDFLLKHKQGYCTHFASALALLGRASGVPTRLATGYRVAEWSPVSQEYVVREKNAHAWVEAWVDGEWRTYDPTPTVELPQDVKHTASFAVLVTDSLNRLEQAVAYALSHVTLAQLLSILAALGGVWWGVRWLQARRGTSGLRGRVVDRDLPLPCFATLAAFLEKRGVGREEAEPLGRFARRLEGAGLNEAAVLVDRYAELRYGGIGDAGALDRDVARLTRRPA